MNEPREYRFTTWDDTALVVTVTDEDPGDKGEPRMLVDYDDGPTSYVAVKADATRAAERTLDVAWREVEAALPEGWTLTVEQLPDGVGWYVAAAPHPPMDEWDDRGAETSDTALIEALDALRAAVIEERSRE